MGIGGRPATYCSSACRQRAFRRRAAPPPVDADPLPLGGAPQVALDGFVGRQSELRRLRSLLRSTRLLTLVGPPGVGKSRLAAELARAHAGAAHLMCLDRAVSLATRRRLVTAIGERRLLVVLDDCDHMARQAARLAERLVRACAGVRVLATARGPLYADDEATLRVATLPLPAGRDRAAALRSPAVRLFVERAHAADPAFELTARNAALVIDICAKLDGLPLAIELAARRAGVLGLPQLLAGLADDLTLLTDGSRTGPDRHRDLAAAVEWSHHQLTPSERTVFRRLSVLPGGFDLAAAADVCGDAAVLPTLVVPALADRSLVVESGQPVRYRQPAAVRAYAADRLAAAGETTDTTSRAVDRLVRLVEPTTETIYLPDDLLARLCREQENIAAALRWTERPPGDRHVLLATALARVWQEQDRAGAGRALLAGVLAEVRTSAYLGDTLATLAEIACRQGDLDEALAAADRAVRRERDTDRPIGLARALHVRAFTLLCRGEEAEAIPAQRECLAIVGELGHDADTVLVTINLAWLLLQAGQRDEAERLLAQRVVGDADLRVLPRAHAEAMHTVGVLRLARDDLAAAERSFGEGLGRTSPESLTGAPLLEGLAIVDARRGNPERALCLAAAAGAVRRRLGVTAGVEWRHQVAAAVAVAGATVSPARATAATAAGERMRGPVLRSYALGHLTAADIGREPAGDRLLTEREQAIVGLIADGRTNREIADRLHLSVGTVRAAVTGLHSKLYLRSRLQLAVWATTQAQAFRNGAGSSSP
jgi:predicted ATPase/DNA-binding CsgD family transcriptional regulator